MNVTVNQPSDIESPGATEPNSRRPAESAEQISSPLKNTSSNIKNEVSISLGKRLKKLRIAADKTQEELAFDSNVDKTFISAIERGAANPSVLTLANICHGLGITLEELFQTLSVSMQPTETQRRSNMAQPELKPKRPRLR